MPPDAPAAFFSYSREDKEFALHLAEDLKAAGANVWMDELDIEPGQEWDNAIEDAVSRSPRMLLILSTASVQSRNVRNEIAFALDEKKTIIPVLYQDCMVPLQLRRVQHIDFRTDYARGLKALLRTLGAEPPSERTLPASPDVPSADERKRVAALELMSQAAEKARREVEQERSQVAQQSRREEPGKYDTGVVQLSKERQEASEQERLEEQRKLAAEQALLEQGRKQAAEQARLEQERKQAAEQARLEQEHKQGAEQARLEQQRKQTVEQARLERERKQAAEVKRVEQAGEPAVEAPLFASYPAELDVGPPLSLLFSTSNLRKAALIGVIWAVCSYFVTSLLRHYPFYFILAVTTFTFGLSLGALLKKTMPAFRWSHAAGIAVGWGFAGVLGGYYILHGFRFLGFRLDWITGHIVIAIVAAAMTVLVMRTSQTTVTLKQALVIAGGYVSGATVSSLAFYYAYSPVNRAAEGLVFGLIGSGVMFWQLSRVDGSEL